MKDISSQNRNSRLRQILIDYFDEGELRTLCADLQVDYDTLPGEGKDNQARELVSYLDRRSRLAELVKVGKEHRPNAPWEADTDVCQEPVPDSPPAQAPTSSVRVNNQPSPYRGLQVFREEHTEFFFGREIFTERLIGEVQQRSQRSAFKPLVAVIGASGSGKSSVIFAGLVPRLRQTGAWECVDFRPGSRPFAALASALLPLFDLQKNEEDPVGETLNLAEQLRQGEVKLSDIVNKIIQQEKEVDHLLLIVDQFEEIYTLCKDGELRERFLDMLLQTIDVQQHQRRMVLVLTLRADFLSQALTHRPLTDALQGSIEMLGPMTSPEMMQAIVEPAKKLNVSFETGLVEHILQDVDVGSDQGRLPLLEFALELLWQSEQLTHAAYNALGGVKRALAQQANKFYYEHLDEPDRQRLEHLVVQLVQPGEGTEDTRRRATRAEIGEANWTLVTRLASKRLVITARNDTGEETVEIVHEALIREWGLLRKWMHSHRSFRLWQERLRFMLRQWQTSNQDEEALLRGFLLSEAQEWLSKQEYSLSQSEREFIQQSIALRERKEQMEAVLQRTNTHLTHWVRELEQRSHEITLLNNMGDLIEACRTTEEAYAVIGQVAPQLFPSESGALYILRASHTFLEAVALWGPLPVQQVCGLHECWSLRRRRRHLSYSDQPELVCLHLPDPLPESALCYPMTWQGEMLGIFHLCREVGSLTEATQQLANTTTKSLSLALANIRLREMLHHQTIRDPLTGLHNRRYLDAALPRELQRADRHGHAVAVVMLDMDYFKRFNDSFGHDAGDKLLWEMGNLLRTHTRGEDIACRYGGEEFVLIIPGVSLSAGIQRMEQLRASVQQLTITYQGQSLGTVTLSLGVAVYPDHGITAEELLRAADAALYKAKADGRNRVVVA